MSEGKWIYISKTSRRCTKRKNKWQATEKGCETKFEFEHKMMKFDVIYKDTLHSLYFKELINKIYDIIGKDSQEFEDMILCVYGLGSGFNNAFINQFCLATCIKNYYNINDDSTWLSDPIMSESVVNIIRKYGFNVQHESHKQNSPYLSLSSNIESKLKVRSNRILWFYMPHCSCALYGSAVQLAKTSVGKTFMIILGNNLEHYKAMPSNLLIESDLEISDHEGQIEYLKSNIDFLNFEYFSCLSNFKLYSDLTLSWAIIDN